MKLLSLSCLALLVMASGAHAMQQEPDPANAGLFAMLPLEVTRYIAGIVQEDYPDCNCGHCGNPLLDWKDINSTQSTCKFLRKYFIPDNRQIWVDFSSKRQEDETVEAFLNRVLVQMLKCKLYPHAKPMALKLNDNRLSEDEPALAAFFKNLYILGLSERIEELELSINSLTILPNLFLEPLHNLKFLDLYANNLTTPEVAKICTLTNLEHLNISGNNIHMLPEEIGALQNLEGLIISYNDLGQLPDSISSLKKLYQIDLSGNHLPSREVDKSAKLNYSMRYILFRIQLQNCQRA